LPNIPGIKTQQQWEQQMMSQNKPQGMTRGNSMLTLGSLLQGLR